MLTRFTQKDTVEYEITIKTIGFRDDLISRLIFHNYLVDLYGILSTYFFVLYSAPFLDGIVFCEVVSIYSGNVQMAFTKNIADVQF